MGWLFVAGALLSMIGMSGCTAAQSGAPSRPASASSTALLGQRSVSPQAAAGHPSSDPDPVAGVAVPAGEQAVDALGLEVFVPKELMLDPPCAGNSINRPASGLTYTIGCTALAPPAVEIATAKNVVDSASPARSTTHCLRRPVLDGETGCIVQDPTQNTDSIDLAAIWPRHDVGIQVHVAAGRSTWAMRVFDSARWVPVDRYGCAASRSTVELPEVTTAGGGILPDDTTSLTICWYSHNRLVASSSVGAKSKIQAIAHPTGVTNGPGITLVATYTPQATAPLCTELDKTEGIVFFAHFSGRADGVSTAQLADCRGQQQWTDGSRSIPTGESLASALRAATGFLLVYGYNTGQQ